MERLSGIDATFLYLETPASHMHVAMTGIYDTSTMADGYSFEAFRDHIASRFHRIPAFTRRLVQVPFRLHHPVWIEDPDFDVGYHIRRIGCPYPGGRRELAEVASQIASIPLDRSRPLWEVWVIEGLKHQRVGFIAKVHHAAIDGAAGAEIMTELYDLEPSPAPRIDTELPDPERVPTEVELVSYALASKARKAANVLPLVGRTIQGVANVVNNRRDPAGLVGAVPLTAPRTPWNHSISPRRSVAFARIPLDQTKEVKDVNGVKLNDVVLAVCAGTLRNYLDAHGGVPAEPLLSVCPVSVRTDDEAGAGGNRVSAMFTSLATDIDDPLARLAAISESTQGAKTEHNAVGARMLTDWGEFAAPRTFAMASRLYSSLKVADRHRPVHNVVVSNVPGPPFPLYLAGSELVAAYPMGPLMDGAGLNITVLSYKDSIDFGFMVDPELIGDVWELADHTHAAFAELVAASRPASTTNATAKKSGPARSTAKRPARTRTPKKAAPKKAAPKKAAPKKAAPKKAAPKKAAKKPADAKSAAKKSTTAR